MNDQGLRHDATWLLTLIIASGVLIYIMQMIMKNSVDLALIRNNASPELCEVWHKHANQRSDAIEERLSRLEGIASMTLGARVVAEVPR